MTCELLKEYFNYNKNDFINKFPKLLSELYEKKDTVDRFIILSKFLLLCKELNFNINVQIDGKEVIENIFINYNNRFEYITLSNDKIFFTLERKNNCFLYSLNMKILDNKIVLTLKDSLKNNDVIIYIY